MKQLGRFQFAREGAPPPTSARTLWVCIAVLLATHSATSVSARPKEGPSRVAGSGCLLDVVNELSSRLLGGTLRLDVPGGFQEADSPFAVDGVIELFIALEPGEAVQQFVPPGNIHLDAMSADGRPYRTTPIECPGNGEEITLAIGPSALAAGSLLITNAGATHIVSLLVRSDGGTSWGANILPPEGIDAGGALAIDANDLPVAGYALLEDELDQHWLWPFALQTPMGDVVIAHTSNVYSGDYCTLSFRNEAPIPLDVMRVEGEQMPPLQFGRFGSTGIAPGEARALLVPPGTWVVIWRGLDDGSKFGKTEPALCPAGGSIEVTASGSK